MTGRGERADADKDDGEADEGMELVLFGPLRVYPCGINTINSR